MSAPTASQKAGAAIAVLAVVGALVAHSVTPSVSPHGHHVSIPWQGTPPTGVSCLRVTALASEAALQTFGLAADAGPQYVRVRICSTDSDGGQPSLPSGMEVVGSPDETAEAFDGGQPELEAWAPGTSTPAPDMCACSIGASCSVPSDDGGTVAAPLGVTLQPGWSGAGCVPKNCTVLAGREVWPSACPMPDGGL